MVFREASAEDAREALMAEVEARAFDVGRRLCEKPRAALGLLKRELGLGRRQAFEAARTAESVMHALCFADPATQATIRENYHPGTRPATERQGT